MNDLGVICGLTQEADCLGVFPADQRPSVRCSGARTQRAFDLARQLTAEGCRGLLSFGTAGGLTADLKPGAVVIPQSVAVDDSRVYETSEPWRDSVLRGLADAEAIDQAIELGLAPRFTTAGPLKQRDINGLKMHVRVAEHLWKELGGWEEPLAYLQAMVERGETGLDSGKGYYDWSGQDPTAVRSQKDEQLIRRTEQVMADWRARKKY